MHCLIQILIAAATIGSWIFMFRRGGGSVLSRQGLASLKYFTTLSNIFAGLTALTLLIFYLAFPGRYLLPLPLALLWYTSAVCVGLTFLVTLFFLAPKMGFAPLYGGELFFLHAAGPLLVIFSFLFSSRIPPLPFPASFLSVIPTFLYGSFYVANILKNGLGEGEDTNDWYGFAAGGIRTIPAAFLIVLTVTWLFALLLLKLSA